jgi:hypothetical protein
MIRRRAAFELHRVCAQEMAGFDDLLDRVPRGARLLALSFAVGSRRVHVWPWVFAGSVHRARSGGVALPRRCRIECWDTSSNEASSVSTCVAHGPRTQAVLFATRSAEHREAPRP